MKKNITQLNKKLQQEVRKYALPQCVRVGLTYLKELYPNEDFDTLYSRFRFKANPSLSFAKSEIFKIEFIEKNDGIILEVTINFMSLFGASSPLPSHYSEMVLDSVDSDEVLKDFLNLFNHHIQKMIYPIWKRNRFYIQYQTALDDKFSKYVLSILGLYSQSQIKSASLNIHKLLPYAGILSMKQKSAGTLVSILRHYLEHKALEIIQCVPMNEEIPFWQLSRLGNENCVLGKDTLIGNSIRTSGSKFQILLNDVSFDGLYEYGFHGAKIVELEELIDLALSEPLEFELCVNIKKDEIKPFELSKHYLGVNCFMGLAENNENIILNR